MATYNIIPNSQYIVSSKFIFNTIGLQKIEKIMWCKNVGDYLNPGDILCIIYYSDYIFEMECIGGNYLLYKNTKKEVRYSNILSIVGDQGEDIKPILKKHNQDIENYKCLNDPLFIKTFQIENTFTECTNNLID